MILRRISKNNLLFGRHIRTSHWCSWCCSYSEKSRFRADFLFFLLLFKYSFLTFPHTPPHHLSPAHLLPCFYPSPYYSPCVLYSCSCKTFTLSPHYLLPSPLWSLSGYSQFQCFWLHFACMFILLIRFQLKVRSYGICLSLSGRFLILLLLGQLAEMPTHPKVLLWANGAIIT